MSGVKTHDPEDITAAREGAAPCDCLAPCTCYEDGYAQGQYQALANYIESIEGDPPHTKRCRCAICYIRQTWDEIQKTGTDPETIARKMVKFTKGLKRFSG